jgi:hypothetical protein
LTTTPTLSEVRKQWTADLQVNGLLLLDSAARSGNAEFHIRTVLQNHSEDMGREEFTYFYRFVMFHAEKRGLISFPASEPSDLGRVGN